jgi:hypothetical protein
MKKFVLLIYQGPTPAIPGTDSWKSLSEAEQNSVYAESFWNEATACDVRRYAVTGPETNSGHSDKKQRGSGF